MTYDDVSIERERESQVGSANSTECDSERRKEEGGREGGKSITRTIGKQKKKKKKK